MTDPSRADGYRLALAAPSEAEAMFALMREVWAGLADKDVFAVGEMPIDFFTSCLNGGGFGVTARTEAGELAGMLIVCYPGLTPENLGYDIGLTEEELPRVCNMDTACVAPAHRGHRLERRMLLFAEEALAGTPYRHLMCTISPHNTPSLRSAEALGYRVAATKEKYGGFLRHVLIKEREGV
ncbi:MAG: GNAT family N-acetyltransferase [Clostridia bacterium]|nr:GNAT family N-acetyltransferase [Clostridia bacterium]